MRRLSRTEKVRDLQRRMPRMTWKVAKVAMKDNDSGIIDDLYKIIKTHSCKRDKDAELAEHVIALVASRLPGADERYLREQAFGVNKIDNGSRKKFEINTISRVAAESGGWMIYWGDDSLTGTLLMPAADGYIPKPSDEVWLYVVRCSLILGRVVEGHVFSYKTLEQEDAEQLKNKAELYV